MASCLESKRLFDGEKLPATGPLYAEVCHHTSDVISKTARVKAKPGMLSPSKNSTAERRLHGCSHS